MDLDDDLCLCFHVTRRKVMNFLRVERPRRAGQLSECFGAGTGCGWCRPFLRELFQQAQTGQEVGADLPHRREYSQRRSSYIQAGKGTPPPGASPADPTQLPTGD